ncbi:hypothetical protein CLOSTMETH_02432 [[Clostridium] methylpentosum DSM 5476]|uniref:Uncharacterized protein n=1 Tax=[Clostridium] methylpentosum DSM 5476 TaxID=537013 RepID=C0EEZ3_9FIRM|nr:hypothetical protein CLOSTMETH_02432 [[Clostridium] methylpentosum DSM 5476]
MVSPAKRPKNGPSGSQERGIYDAVFQKARFPLTSLMRKLLVFPS